MVLMTQFFRPAVYFDRKRLHAKCHQKSRQKIFILFQTCFFWSELQLFHATVQMLIHDDQY